MSYVWALLGFCALITLHELGHFTAAKAVGMRVERFSLFFGPMWLRRRIGETDYGIGVIPLGGYVKITGMSPEEVFEEPSVEARAYVNQPVWKRVVVILAGPVVNIVLAFLIIWAVFLSHGYVNQNAGPLEIGAITSHSAAAGVLKLGDQIVSVDGHSGQSALKRAVDATRCPGAQTDGCTASPAVHITVRRHGMLHSFALHPRYDATLKRPLLGVKYGVPGELESLGPGPAAGKSVSAMWTEISASFTALGHIYQAKERKQLHGTVGIYVMTQEATRQGAAEGLFLLGVVSLVLGVFNLLPFLPLDGGHIVWALIEKLRKGRKTSLATMERASYVGLALFAMLVVIGFSNDISTIINGGSFLNR